MTGLNETHLTRGGTRRRHGVLRRLKRAVRERSARDRDHNAFQ